MSKNNTNAKALPEEAVLDQNQQIPLPATPENQQMPLPATPENQYQTTDAMKDAAAKEDAINQAKASLQSSTRLGFAKEPDKVSAALEAKKLQSNRQAQEQLENQIADNDLNQQKNIIEEKIRRANEAQAFYTNTFNTADPEIDSEIASLQEQLQSLNIAEQQVQAPGEIAGGDPLTDPKNVEGKIRAQDALDLQDKSKEVKNSYLDQLAEIQGQAEATEAKRAELIEEQNKIFSDVQELRKQAKESQVDPIWESGSTGTKIMAALAIGLGAYRAAATGSNVNQGLQLVNDIIDRTAKQNQQSFKNQLVLKDALLDKTSRQLAVLNSQSQSQSQKANIARIQAQLQAQQQQVQQQILQQQQKQMINEKLRAGKTNIQEERKIFDNLSKEQIAQANVLRKDYERAIRDNQIETIIPSIRDMQDFTNSPSAAGDIALIFSYMKSLDPKSVVREGEFQLASDAGPKAQKAVVIANRILTGERLTESVRRDFFNRAKGMVKNRLKSASEISNRFKNLAVSQGIPPKAGLGLKEYSYTNIMPNEAAMDMLKKELKLPEDKIQQMLDKRGIKAADLLMQ